LVIRGGYKERMGIFFQRNLGFGSRTAHHIDFLAYTLSELMAVAEFMVHEQMYIFNARAQQAFAEYLQLRVKQPRFANARGVCNAIDRIKLRQANRLVQQGGSTKKTSWRASTRLTSVRAGLSGRLRRRTRDRRLQRQRRITTAPRSISSILHCAGTEFSSYRVIAYLSEEPSWPDDDRSYWALSGTAPPARRP
jgi:hypothetical protein